MGAKHAFELWPEPLVARCRATRHRKAAPEQRALVAAATAALAAWEARHGGAGGTAGAPLAARKAREELEARLALLAELEKGHTDYGAPNAATLPWVSLLWHPPPYRTSGCNRAGSLKSGGVQAYNIISRYP